jgi:ribonuclease HI
MEMELLGFHSSAHDIYATDGSLEGSREFRTSLRVETVASYLALERAKDIRAPIFILTDSAKHLSVIDDWVGPGRYPTLHSSKDGDIVRVVLELLHHRVNLGFPTFFVKVRAHRGEPYNEAADRLAYTATND